MVVVLVFLHHLEPKMKLLHELVIPKIYSQWKIVGTCLNYTQERIQQIEQAESDCYQCCADLLRDWLRTNGAHPCSWESLLAALKQSPQLTSATQEIEKGLTWQTKSVYNYILVNANFTFYYIGSKRKPVHHHIQSTTVTYYDSRYTEAYWHCYIVKHLV